MASINHVFNNRNTLGHDPKVLQVFVFDLWTLTQKAWKGNPQNKLNGQVMNCNLKELFSCIKSLVDAISSEQTHIKILAYLKLLKLVHASVLEFDVSKYVKKISEYEINIPVRFP